jgi:multiple sugar transport system permease protein
VEFFSIKVHTAAEKTGLCWRQFRQGDKPMTATRSLKQMRRHENYWAALFLLPSTVGFLIFILFPVIFSFLLSFGEWNFLSGFGGIRFVGLKNFFSMFTDKVFRISLKNNILFTLTTVPVGIALALILAVLIRSYAWFKTYIKISFFIPYISSIVAVSIVWKVMLHPSMGPINQTLAALGIEDLPRWFQDRNWALPSIIALSIWQNLGYSLLIYVAALGTIPPELYEAARIDGANPVQEFFRVTIPMVSPTTFFMFIINMIGSFRVFDQISVITDGGPGNATNVLAYYIYQNAFTYYRMGYASSIAWFLFIIIFTLTLIQRRFQRSVTY